MFLTKEDLGFIIYGYQVEQITEGDDNIVLQALQAAESEARGYLAANVNRKANYDGRALYDVAAIFNTEGTERSAIIVQHAVTLAKWHLCQLCNAEIIIDQAKDRYDRAVAWFRDVASGAVFLDDLPTISLETEETLQPFSFGSRAKFNHDY